MKLILSLFLLCFLHTKAQTSFYDLNVETAYGGRFSLSQYEGQKVVIAAVNIDNFKKKAALQFWDSLQTAHPKIAFVLIPSSDHDSAVKDGDAPVSDSIATKEDSAVLQDVKGRVSEKMLLAEMGKAKKAQGDRQHPLMRWLTDVKQNTHFNLDVESDVQIYVISESGELYAVLTRDTPLSFLNAVLKQEDVTPSVFGQLQR
jgi:glutathione peroxidase-family protein